MEFRLVYEGELLSAQSGAADKLERVHKIRKQIHVQLCNLLKQNESLGDYGKKVFNPSHQPNDCFSLREWGTFKFAPFINKTNYLCGELEILLLLPEGPGGMFKKKNNGDLDNRIKSLIDALRMPSQQEIPSETPEDAEQPFYCLFEDDNLLTDFSVRTDYLLKNTSSKAVIMAVIKVKIKAVRLTFMNIAIAA